MFKIPKYPFEWLLRLSHHSSIREIWVTVYGAACSLFTLLRVDEKEVKFEGFHPTRPSVKFSYALCLHKDHGINSMAVPEEEVSLLCFTFFVQFLLYNFLLLIILIE